ncbi:MAG: hypothetical protein KatS3mg027_0039 [Bacteroidia bacterium]|nr:MAG: hypothetical protein KatS3mg027_0039 [Bacteroidia bacterium]
MNKKILICGLILVLFSNLFFAQKRKGQTTQVERDINTDSLTHYVLKEINQFRKKNRLDTFELYDRLTDASYLSAEDLSDDKKSKADAKELPKYLKSVGLTNKAEQLAGSNPLVKSKKDVPYKEIAQNITAKWINGQKEKLILLNPKYIYVGIGMFPDAEFKKIYISAIFGGNDISNEGASHKKELKPSYNTLSKKFNAPNDKKCKNCKVFKNYDLLHQGLYIENGKIYLKYNNLKELKRLLKKPKDGIAVDIVQRSQFTKAEYNIVDNNLLNKGIMQKVIYKDKLFASNKLLDKKDQKKNRKLNELLVEVGKVPKNLKGEYELNLLIIQDNRICKTITQSYTELLSQEGEFNSGILPIEAKIKDNKPFVPTAESNLITFIIPFEKNKYEYKQEDIQPLIDALDEPDYTIEGLYIYAYSSIEGDSVTNAKLQIKRAESVAKVLQDKQSVKVKPVIITNDSWNLFMLENEDGPYASLVAMGKKKAIQKINSDKKLLQELEPILARERFAQVVMDVTYDITGNKEQKYTYAMLKKSVKSGDTARAFKILQYIFSNIKNNKYPRELLDTLNIPISKENIPFTNNLVYFKYQLNNSLTDNDAEILKKNFELDNSNPILQYNALFAKIKTDTMIGNKDVQQKIQQEIESLSKTNLDKLLINNLNAEWQFKLIDYYDTIPNSEAQIETCLNNIKKFYNIEESSWQNTVKLANIFARAKLYWDAANVLEPLLTSNDVNEKIVFNYISIASHLPEKFHSRYFTKAMQLARKYAPDRFCKLFGKPYLSFQILENPGIKKEFLQSNCEK